MQLIKQKYKKN